MDLLYDYDGILAHIRLTVDSVLADEQGYDVGYIFRVNDWPYEAMQRTDLGEQTLLILERLNATTVQY